MCPAGMPVFAAAWVQAANVFADVCMKTSPLIRALTMIFYVLLSSHGYRYGLGDTARLRILRQRRATQTHPSTPTSLRSSILLSPLALAISIHQPPLRSSTCVSAGTWAHHGFCRPRPPSYPEIQSADVPTHPGA